MSRTHPREPEQQTLPPRLDPRAGRPRTASSAGGGAGSGGGARSGFGRLATATRVVAALAAAAILGTSGWGWYLGEVADSSVNRTDAIPTTGNVDQFDGAAMNLLLVGSDSRARLSQQQASELNTGTVAGQNTDTMMLVHVPADGSAASFVSFPRDSWVEIPGIGEGKLNSAYAYGYNGAPDGATAKQKQAAGAQLLIQTISQLSGVKIDHYAEVDLLGFFELSNVVGGVEVNLCQPAVEKDSGINLPAGKQTISGQQALAFVRQRHGLLRGDYDRIVRQQTFIAAMIRKMLAQDVLLDLGKQRELVTAAAHALTVDQSLDLMGLAQQMQSIKPGEINFQTVPIATDGKNDDGVFVTNLVDEQQMHEFFRDLTADPEPADPTKPAQTVERSAVTVDVYNGSGIGGLAASASEDLTAKGFGAGTTGNADSSSYTTTEIRHAPGEEALANTVLAAIPGATVVESAEVPAGSVHLVLGSDYNGVGQKVDAQPAETSGDTTAAAKPRTAADTDCIN